MRQAKQIGLLLLFWISFFTTQYLTHQEFNEVESSPAPEISNLTEIEVVKYSKVSYNHHSPFPYSRAVYTYKTLLNSEGTYNPDLFVPTSQQYHLEYSLDKINWVSKGELNEH